jgi:hypothetical protein
MQPQERLTHSELGHERDTKHFWHDAPTTNALLTLGEVDLGLLEHPHLKQAPGESSNHTFCDCHLAENFLINQALWEIIETLGSPYWLEHS